METAAETHPISRELTQTEIKIAIAQIEDRLTRVCKAQNELYDFDFREPEDESIDDGDHKAMEEYWTKWNARKKIKEAELRNKYDIPNGVHLFCAEEGSGYYTAKDLSRHIGAFVKGQMTDESYSDMWFFMEECFEFDYGWVLIERPLGFYDAGTEEDVDFDEIQKELRSIATRSRKKNMRLPVIAEGWSNMFQLAAPEDESDPSTDFINRQMRFSAPVKIVNPSAQTESTP